MKRRDLFKFLGAGALVATVAKAAPVPEPVPAPPVLPPPGTSDEVYMMRGDDRPFMCTFSVAPDYPIRRPPRYEV